MDKTARMVSKNVAYEGYHTFWVCDLEIPIFKPEEEYHPLYEDIID